MKFLIVPGMAKAGTTFLFHNMIRSPHVFNIPYKEETRFFDNNNSFVTYMSEFKTHDEDRYFLDISPSYMHYGKSTLHNIESAIGNHDLKWLLCLRAPVQQAFSHYQQQLKFSLSRLMAGLEIDYSFFSRWSLQDVLRPRLAFVRAIIDRFGRDSILLFNAHQDFAEAAGFNGKLAQFLGTDPIDFDYTLTANPGGWTPYFLYNPDRDTAFEQHGTRYRLPRRALLLVNGDFSELFADIEPSIAERIIRQSQYWTRDLSKQDVSMLYDSFLRDDFLTTLSALSLSEDDFPVRREVIGKAPLVSAHVLGLLQVENLSNAVDRIWRSNRIGAETQDPVEAAVATARAEPESAWRQASAAVMLLSAGRATDAQALMEELSPHLSTPESRDAEFGDYLRMRAQIYIALKKPTDGVPFALRAARHHPSCPVIAFDLGYLLVATGRMEEAVAPLAHSIGLTIEHRGYNRNPQAYSLLAQALAVTDIGDLPYDPDRYRAAIAAETWEDAAIMDLVRAVRTTRPYPVESV